MHDEGFVLIRFEICEEIFVLAFELLNPVTFSRFSDQNPRPSEIGFL